MKELMLFASLMYEKWKAVFWVLSSHCIHSYTKKNYRKFSTYKKAERKCDKSIYICHLTSTINAQSCFIYIFTCSLHPWIILKHIIHIT